MLILECNKPFQRHPGYCNLPLGTARLYRVWWLWFAAAWVNMSYHAYHKLVASGATEWRRR